MSNFEIVLFKLLPPDDDYNFWRIDTDGNIEQWDLDSFAIYIKTLQLAQKFMAEKQCRRLVDKAVKNGIIEAVLRFLSKYT